MSPWQPDVSLSRGKATAVAAKRFLRPSNLVPSPFDAYGNVHRLCVIMDSLVN
ncbi:MAG: hypothetical protein PVG45_04455 [Gammaproteobacteria bacterium]